MLTHNLLLLAALAVPAAPLPPEHAAGLRWKFEKGVTFYQEMTSRADQTMTIGGQEIKQKQLQTFVMSWTPEKEDGDRWVLRMKIEGVKMEMELGDTKISYDSTKPKARKEALDDFFAGLVGCELRVTLDKGCKVHKLEGREEFVKKVSGDNAQMQALLSGILGEDAMKELANPMLITVPRREVGKGDYWVTEKTQDMGPIGQWVARWQYVYTGKEKKLIKLKLEALNCEFLPPKDGGKTPLPFRITGSNFKTKNSSGTILFDPEKGRLDSAEMSMDLDGEFTFDIGGQPSPVSLKQSQKMTYKVSDTNPLLKK